MADEDVQGSGLLDQALRDAGLQRVLQTQVGPGQVRITRYRPNNNEFGWFCMKFC